MANEKFTLTWPSHSSHFQDVLANLLTTEESSDVTLVCADQVKFKSHKFVLKACSPVFESIFQENFELQSAVYLRGINQLELKPILDFIYSGQASFHHKRMKEFLEVGKDLQITGIKDLPVEVNTLIEENVNETNQDTSPEDESSDDINSVDEIKNGISTAINITSQHQSVPSSNLTKCTQCDLVFTQRHSMLKHVRYKHEGVRYPCSQCDFKATCQSDLRRHIESVHEGFKYPCSQCDYKARVQSSLKIHIESLHEGVKYPCRQCDFKATCQSNLRRHIESVHEGVKYPCSQCDYKASQQSSLKMHIESVHEGVKYPCSQCDFKALGQYNLRRHMKRIHKL